MTKFLSIKQVLVIHSNLITQFGGSKGIRSMNSLESALYRMMASFDGYVLGLQQLGLPFCFRSRVDWWTAIVNPPKYGNKVNPSRIY